MRNYNFINIYEHIFVLRRYLRATSDVSFQVDQEPNEPQLIVCQSPDEAPSQEPPAYTEYVVAATIPPAALEEKITLKDILHFPMAIWLICVLCVAYYVAVFPFISLGLVFFERKCPIFESFNRVILCLDCSPFGSGQPG